MIAWRRPSMKWDSKRVRRTSRTSFPAERCSAPRAFRESVDAVAGRANYQIVGDAGTLDENLLLTLRWIWQRGGRFAPVIDVEGIVESSQLPIRLLAVDLLSDLHFRDYKYAT